MAQPTMETTIRIGNCSWPAICGVTKIIHVPDGCTDIDSEAVMIMMMLVKMMTLRMTMMLMTVV